MAGKKEFTAQDMKKAFEAGARMSDAPPSWALQRWMRNQYPQRYARKKAKSAKAGQ